MTIPPPVYALLADGSTVQIRTAEPGDYEAVKAMHEAMSPDNIYLRFFSVSRVSAEPEAQRVCRAAEAGHTALLAVSSEEIVGCASYESPGDGTAAEVAFAVADRMHHQGIATLLLEHLVVRARHDGIPALVASTLAENTAMLRVFADAGLPVRRRLEDGVFEVTVPVPGQDPEGFLSAVERREGSADIASLRHVFAPASVVVIGASLRKGTAGRTILDNVHNDGFQGVLYAVNPHARYLGGVKCVPSVAELPETPELAVIAVPPPSVTQVAEACGARGVKALVVITAGLDTGACADLLAICRRHGMRLVGPDSFGIAVPSIGLDATFAASHPAAGNTGLLTQSGGTGLALVGQLSRLGIGISSFASVGDKLDVSGNDLLMWWERDGVTKLAIMYIESFGNPRKFARTARRVGETIPVLTVHAGQRPAASHTAALASRQALFEQAGVIAAPGVAELIEVAALLATQPVPAGRTVALISNVAGAGTLAAGACSERGLTVHQPHGHLKRRLRTLVPDGATATISANAFREWLELLSAADDVDAIIALVLPTATTGDLISAIQQADVPVPLAAVVLNQAESVRMLDGQIPAYAHPEAAVAALARAAAYRAWRTAPRGEVAAFPDVMTSHARALVREFLCSEPGGGWLPPDTVAELLASYGLSPVPFTTVHSEDHAVTVAAAASGPVALKVRGPLHKTGAVRLDLRTPTDVRDAYRSLDGAAHNGIALQPMITGGTEVLVRVTDDHMFGPLIVFGLGGVATNVPAGHAARLAPLTTADADTLIRSVRAAPPLPGHRGAPSADLNALRDLLLRTSRLAEDLPEITELDLNPVIARPDAAFIVDARTKVTPYELQDPFLRRLR